jgi:hypothetical protein
MKANRAIVVIYEDTGARQSAVEFCNCLVERFWAKADFAVEWVPFTKLRRAASAKAVCEKAVVADLVIFAAQPESEFSPGTKAWIESWLCQRGDREGVLAGLFGKEPEVGDKHVYLRSVAHRGGMDYLTGLPQDLFHAMPDSLDSYTERAHQVTGVLEDILSKQTPPRILI